MYSHIYKFYVLIKYCNSLSLCLHTYKWCLSLTWQDRLETLCGEVHCTVCIPPLVSNIQVSFLLCKQWFVSDKNHAVMSHFPNPSQRKRAPLCPITKLYKPIYLHHYLSRDLAYASYHHVNDKNNMYTIMNNLL